MTSRVSSENKEKKAKKKNSVKNKRPKRMQRNRKQRRRDSNPVDLHFQATPWPLHHSDTHQLRLSASLL